MASEKNKYAALHDELYIDAYREEGYSEYSKTHLDLPTGGCPQSHLNKLPAIVNKGAERTRIGLIPVSLKESSCIQPTYTDWLISYNFSGGCCSRFYFRC